MCAHAEFITFGRTERMGYVPIQNLFVLAELNALGVCPCRIYYFWHNGMHSVCALGVCPCSIYYFWQN